MPRPVRLPRFPTMMKSASIMNCGDSFVAEPPTSPNVLPACSQTPACRKIEQIRAQRPFVGTRLLAFMAVAGSHERHAARVVTDLTDRFDLLSRQALLWQAARSSSLLSIVAPHPACS